MHTSRVHEKIKRKMNQPFKVGIKNYHNHDVLCGKAKIPYTHPGNLYFRSIIKKLKIEYISLPKSLKKSFAELVVFKVQSLRPPGRFLKQSEETGLWHEIDFDQALFKTRQALREGGPTIEHGIKKGEIEVKTNFLNTGEVDSKVYSDEEVENRSTDASSSAPSESSKASCSRKRKSESMLASPSCVKRSRKDVEPNNGNSKRIDKMGGKAIEGDEIEPNPVQQIVHCDDSAKHAELNNDDNSKRMDKMGGNMIEGGEIEPIPLKLVARCHSSVSSPIPAAMRRFLTNCKVAYNISPHNASLFLSSQEHSEQQNDYKYEKSKTSPTEEPQNEPSQHRPLWGSTLAHNIDQRRDNRGTTWESSNTDLSTSEGPLGKESVHHRRNAMNILDPYFTVDKHSSGTSYISHEKYNWYHDWAGDGHVGNERNSFVADHVNNAYYQREQHCQNHHHDSKLDHSMSNDATVVASELERNRSLSDRLSSPLSPASEGNKTNEIGKIFTW